MRTWHDYHLIGYCVDGRTAEIAFNLIWPYQTATDVPAATVVFSGVAGYFFENDLGSNILYSIEERPLREFIDQQRATFEVSRKWGWPTFLKVTDEETISYLVERGLKCFDVSSSYGLSGWIVASRQSRLLPLAVIEDQCTYNYFTLGE